MATKKLKVGDPVLWYGMNLNVVEVRDGDVPVVEVADTAGVEARETARREIASLREQQSSAKGRDHDEIAEKIRELDATASAATVRARLRVDLLSWWDERKVWVSEGRILTDDQIERFRSLTGTRPLPNKQREAFSLLEGRA